MLTVVHLFSFNNNSFWKLLSVNLFRRGLAISPALNKRSTTTNYGSTVLYLINTDGKRGSLMFHFQVIVLLARGLSAK